MSYATIAKITQSASLTQRLTAAAAQEGKGSGEGETGPETWVYTNRWTLAAAPGWSDAWESAEAGGVTDPGASEAVITDGMILAVVQPMP